MHVIVWNFSNPSLSRMIAPKYFKDMVKRGKENPLKFMAVEKYASSKGYTLVHFSE